MPLAAFGPCHHSSSPFWEVVAGEDLSSSYAIYIVVKQSTFKLANQPSALVYVCSGTHCISMLTEYDCGRIMLLFPSLQTRSAVELRQGVLPRGYG